MINRSTRKPSLALGSALPRGPAPPRSTLLACLVVAVAASARAIAAHSPDAAQTALPGSSVSSQTPSHSNSTPSSLAQTGSDGASKTTVPVSAMGEAAAPLQEVFVTGSRIPVPANIAATSPVTVVSREEIELQGYTDATDIVNQLPQNFVNASVDYGNTSNPLNAPGGIATIDLRGLGPQRTLVLVNGRRLGVGDSNTGNPNPAPDIDQVPPALIQRIDVVTGGASAVYGSDAIAGVVNFVLRKNFQGVEIDGQYGFNDHGNHDSAIQAFEQASGIGPPTGTTTNGYRRDFSIILGTNTPDGTGNVTGYFEYHHQDGVPGSDYDFADCLLVTGYGCLNSANSNRFAVAGTQTPYTVVGNELLPWPQPGSVPPAEFNPNTYQYLQREDERYLAGVLAHVRVADWARPYLEVMFMNDRTTENQGPSGVFSGQNPFTADNSYLVNCANPLLSAQELGVLQSQGACLGTPAEIATENANLDIGRRNIEGAGRASYYEHTNYRVVGGVTGSVADWVTYDAYAQYSYTSLFNSNSNYFDLQKLASALQVTGTAANPVCISGPPCVPYDIFSQGGVTQAQLDYLYASGTAEGSNDQKILHGDVTLDLGRFGVKSPWDREGVSLNVGAEHRGDGLTFAPDRTELSGVLAGFSGAAVAIDNSDGVGEGFTEVRVPVAHARPWIADLAVDGGYRYSHYTTAGAANTWKFELQYAPTPDARLRVSIDRAVRAPNLIELYDPQAYGEQGYVGTDPCAPTLASGVLVAATATLAQCERTGVTAAQYGNGGTTNKISQCVGGQCGQVIGGNPDLLAEIGRTWSVGVSLTPRTLPGLLATIDYYQIAISGEVGSIPGDYAFNQCLDTGNPVDCALVVRTFTGALHGASVAGGGYILQTKINTGAALVSGVDVGVGYRLALRDGWGTLSAQLNGTWLQHDWSTPYQGAPSYDCAGLFGYNCGTGINPAWRHTLRVTWATPWRVLLSARWRYIGESGFDNNSPDPSLQYFEEGGYQPINAHIPGYSYLDLTAELTIVQGVRVRVGCDNLLDKDPPLLGGEVTNATAMNSFPSYDTLGRQLFAGFTAEL
jgi:iron complex outermembrane recepter protein